MATVVCAGVGPGGRVTASGLQGFDAGLVPGLLAADAEVLRCAWCRGVLPGCGDGVGRRRVWVLRQGAGRHAEADRCVFVQGRSDAGGLRGPRGGAAPLSPVGEQTERGRRRDGRPVPGAPALGWALGLDRADLRDAGRGVRRVRRHPRRAGLLRRRHDRGVRRHADRIPVQDCRAETVRGAVVPAVRLRRRPGRRGVPGGGARRHARPGRPGSRRCGIRARWPGSWKRSTGTTRAGNGITRSSC